MLVASFNKNLYKRYSCCMFVIFYSTATFAIDSNYISTSYPLPPRIVLTGTSGNNTFGEADTIVPLFGNREQIFYSDATAKFGDDNAWLASLGIGGRKIIHDDAIIGAYLFGDYNKSHYSNTFFVLNPGIEYITNLWDSHLNAYLPLGPKVNYMGTYFGSQLGMTNTTFFSGHTEYGTLFNLLEDVGTGLDVEIGRTFPTFKRARVYAGSYFFSPEFTSNVTGIQVGAEMPLNYKWASVAVSNSYDNVNQNTFVLTLRFSFGGVDKSGTPDIHDRMLDQIPRHLGNLNNGDGIPSKKAVVNTGQTAIVRDNIWFFNSGLAPSLVQGIQSCTFSNPCTGLSQLQIDTINGLAPNANFYFSSGTYNNPAVGAGFSFYNGQNIFGRNLGFQQLAINGARPLLNDSILLNGNNSVFNIRVVANSELIIDSSGTLIPIQTGILVTTSATGIINIYSSDFQSDAAVLNAAGAINNSASATLNINNSTLTSNLANLAGGITIGVGNVSSGNVNINNSSIFVNETDVVNNFNIAFGVVNNESGTLNIANTDVNVTSNNAGLTAAVLNNSTVGRGIINIDNVSLNVDANASFLAADVFNQANNGSGEGGTVNINQSSLTIASNNNGGGTGAAIINSADSTINLIGSTLQSSGNDGTIGGIINTDPLSKIFIQDNSISVDLFGTAVGAPIINNGTVTDNGGNQCFQNGVAVAC